MSFHCRPRRALRALSLSRLALPIAASIVAAAAAAGEPAADDATTRLDGIVVTAEKQGRSQHDTATSTSVLDAQSLDERGIVDSREVFADLVNVTGVGQGNLAPAVRGVDGTGAALGVDAFFAGSRPRLNVTIDGRPASYNEIVFGDNSLWDVQQVEFLRGPQSLLQGRNAIAGTLAIKTRDPSVEREAGVRVIGGDGDRREGAFYLSGPLAGDELALRLAGGIQHRQSYLDFAPYPGVSDPGEFETRTLRAKLAWKPSALPDFTALLTFQHASASAPQTETVSRPFDASRLASTPDMPVFAPRTNAAILDTQWQLADRLRWENLVSSTDLHVDRFAPARTGIARIDTRDWVVEPRLVLDRGDARFGGIAGVHLYRANQREFIDYPVDERFRDRVRTAAIYGEGTLALGERFDLNFGARYERETHRRNGGEGALVHIDVDQSYSAFLPKIGLAWHPDPDWTVGVFASRGYNAGGGGVTLDAPIVSYSYDAEYVRDYEAYFRADLADGRLQLTGNLFYGEFSDMQLPFDLNPDPAIWAVVIRNADRARNYGAEFGARWLATRELELRADLGLLRTKVTDYPGSGIEGNQFANAPSATMSLGATWRGEGGFEFGVNARYSNAYFSDVENRPIGRTDPYWIANLRGGYRFGKAFVFAGVSNLFDENTPLLITTYSSVPTPYDTAQLPQPRRWYVGLQYDW